MGRRTANCVSSNCNSAGSACSELFPALLGSKLAAGSVMCRGLAVAAALSSGNAAAAASSIDIASRGVSAGSASAGVSGSAAVRPDGCTGLGAAPAGA
jgi:hypothetical protein